MDVGAAMRAARRATGLTQKALARRAGVAPSTLSRCESGAQLPSLALLDRVLAVCGKDLRLQVVERHADLEATFAALAARPLSHRVPHAELFRAGFLADVASVPGRVQVAGSWAAELLGIPTEPAEGRLLVQDDDETVQALAAVLGRHFALLELDGQLASVVVRPEKVRRGVTNRWSLAAVGAMTTTMVPPCGPWPAAEQLPTAKGRLWVSSASELDSATDGVLPEVLDRWFDWRARTPPVELRWE